jgi:hypothetical protein
MSNVFDSVSLWLRYAGYGFATVVKDKVTVQKQVLGEHNSSVRT